MRRGVKAARYVTLLCVMLVSVAAAMIAISADDGPIRLSGASTFELVSVLGLLLLPIATFSALRLDSRWNRRAAHQMSRRRREAL